MSNQITFTLGEYQCGGEWSLTNNVEIEGLEALVDAGYASGDSFSVKSFGFEGIAFLLQEDPSGTLELSIAWETSVNVSKGTCLELYYDDLSNSDGTTDSDGGDCPDVKPVTDCLSATRFATLNDKNEITGYMTMEQLVKCVTRSMSLCDLIPDDNQLEQPDADFQLVGMKGCDGYKIDSTDMCCEPKANVEPTCK